MPDKPRLLEDSLASSPQKPESQLLRVSLVLATINRTTELENFFQHLCQQSYKNFEVILVDQNPGGLLDPIVERFSSCFSIVHLRSEKGLSRARNAGLKHVSGDIIAFPDDDCWYPPELLQVIVAHFSANPSWGGITGRPIDGFRKDAFKWFPRNPASLNILNVWRRHISITMFLRREVVSAVGDFDERLGVGSTTGFDSGEESDYLIRAVRKHLVIQYLPDVVVHHSEASRESSGSIRRAYAYARGMGFVLNKHRYPFWFVCYVWCRAFGGALSALIRAKPSVAKYHFAVLKGRIAGWLA